MFRSFWIILEKKSYLLWCILLLCLGWELLNDILLELRVPCPIIIWCNSCWNKSLSKSWLENHHRYGLQVLLVLCLIWPLKDPLVVLAEMDLKFEKNIFIMWLYKQKIHSDFQIACSLPNLTIEWSNSGTGCLTLKCAIVNGSEGWKDQ